ncbi:MAG: AMP-binding enzyme [Cumulibacter sp.]
MSSHAWKVPERYNITAEIVDSWALSEAHSDRAALAVLDENDYLNEVGFGRLAELTARLGIALGPAVVRLAPDADEALVREQLIASTRATIRKHAHVRRVEVTDEFPKTVTGKLQRAVVRHHFS